MSFLDWTNLSIENIADKGKLIRSALLPGGSGPEVDVPIDPHWSRFEKEVWVFYLSGPSEFWKIIFIFGGDRVFFYFARKKVVDKFCRFSL